MQRVSGGKLWEISTLIALSPRAGVFGGGPKGGGLHRLRHDVPGVGQTSLQNAQASHTPFNISLTVSEAIAIDIQKYEVEQKARVVFSPVEAKIAIYMLVGTIRAFEKAFGEIVVPPGLLQQGDSNKQSILRLPVVLACLL